MHTTPLFHIEPRVAPLSFEHMGSRRGYEPEREAAGPEAEQRPHPAEVALVEAQAAHAEEIAALQAAVEAAREEGRQQGHEARQAEIDAMAQQLGQAVGSLQQAAEALEERCRLEAVDLAVVLARALVGDAVKQEPEALERILWRALDHVPPSDHAALRCHPDDAPAVREHLPALTSRRGDLVEIRLVESPAIERGGVVIEFAEGSVDAQPSRSLDLLREAVESALAGHVPGEETE